MPTGGLLKLLFMPDSLTTFAATLSKKYISVKEVVPQAIISAMASIPAQ